MTSKNLSVKIQDFLVCTTLALNGKVIRNSKQVVNKVKTALSEQNGFLSLIWQNEPMTSEFDPLIYNKIYAAKEFWEDCLMQGFRATYGLCRDNTPRLSRRGSRVTRGSTFVNEIAKKS